jgi:hypothetical protein
LKEGIIPDSNVPSDSSRSYPDRPVSGSGTFSVCLLSNKPVDTNDTRLRLRVRLRFAKYPSKEVRRKLTNLNRYESKKEARL